VKSIMFKVIKEASFGGSGEKIITVFPDGGINIAPKYNSGVRDSVYVIKLVKYEEGKIENTPDYRYRVLAGEFDRETWKNRATKTLRPSLEVYETYYNSFDKNTPYYLLARNDCLNPANEFSSYKETSYPERINAEINAYTKDFARALKIQADLTAAEQEYKINEKKIISRDYDNLSMEDKDKLQALRNQIGKRIHVLNEMRTVGKRTNPIYHVELKKQCE
jgi:hypothetical protein